MDDSNTSSNTTETFSDADSEGVPKVTAPWLLPLIGTVIALFAGYYLYKRVTKATPPPKAKKEEESAVSIPGPGGFDELCVTDCGYAAIGANVDYLPIERGKGNILQSEPDWQSINHSLIEENMNLSVKAGPSAGPLYREPLVLVKVYSFGVNYADVCVRWGLYESAKKHVGWPITPGFEFSGEIIDFPNIKEFSQMNGNKNADGSSTSNPSSKKSKKSTNNINNNGPSVQHLRKGDRVFGVTLFGAYSTHVLVPISQVFLKPRSMTMDQSAGFLTTALTAYYATFQLALPTLHPKLQQCEEQSVNRFYSGSGISGGKGKSSSSQSSNMKEDFSDYAMVRRASVPKRRALVHSASGGVGSMLVQLLKQVAKVETVVGVVGGSHKVNLAKQMGCDIVVDRKKETLFDIWTQAKKQVCKLEDLEDESEFDGFDVIFDANGISTLSKSFDNLRPTGKLVVYGFHSMLPHSEEIDPFQWIGLAWDKYWTPRFDPMSMAKGNKSVMALGLSFLFSRKDILQKAMSDLLTWIDQGLIKVAEVTPYRYCDVNAAHREIQSGRTIGKLVVRCPDYQKVRDASTLGPARLTTVSKNDNNHSQSKRKSKKNQNQQSSSSKQSNS